jgi:cullin 2
MKSKKMMTHATLVEETINSARKRFNPSIPMIKGCIESLIEKGYMERKESAKNYYLYIQ